MSSTIRATEARTLHLWDGLVVFWVVLWAALGVWTGLTLWQAADAGDTISSSGRALNSVGETLEDLSALPLVPKRPGEIGGEVVTTAKGITDRGQEVKGELRRLSLLLGGAIVGIPVAPVVGYYLPVRLSRRREVRSLREQLRRRPDDEGFNRYLAERARRHLTYDQLVQQVAEPSGRRLDAIEARQLADAELARLGLSRPAQSTTRV